MRTARELVKDLRGRWHGRYGMACCPAHKDRTPSLKIEDGRQGIVCYCYGGCSQDAVLDALRRRGLWPEREHYASPASSRSRRSAPSPSSNGRETEVDDGAERRRLARQTWRETQPVEGTVGEVYLRHRGIDLEPPPTIRFLPALRHADTGLLFPALICAVQNGQRRIAAIQRIYLRGDGRGKAGVRDAKMTLGPLGDGACRLAAAGPVLGICEGPEDGLSIMEMFNISVWCAVGGGRLGKLKLPEVVERVVIYGDRGREGEHFADRARYAYARQGRSVDVIFPDSDGDWNDALRARKRETAA